jgi:geranylgeranyl diphosphate synthase type II
MNLQKELDVRKSRFDEELHLFFEKLNWDPSLGVQELKSSMLYSTTRGGKRFRPVLSMLVSEVLGVGPQRVLPLACAIEMIHSYSLIHDDLPCMDNDDFRRGEPTNHKVFGETTALLAGDALGTEAFRALALGFRSDPQIGLQLVELLAEAAGSTGMVAGQAMDLKAQKQKISLEDLERMHRLKTGALIRISCEGAAVACGVSPEKIKKFRQFGELLGLAFQVADDLLDSKEGKVELHSYPGILGFAETEQYLKKITEQCQALLIELSIPKENLLNELVIYNSQRSH